MTKSDAPQVTLSRDGVKVLMMLARDVCQHAQNALQHAPYRNAHEAMEQLENFPDEIGAHLGVGEWIGRCEFCETPILSDEEYSSGDGYLCAECCKGDDLPASADAPAKPADGAT